MPHTGIPNLQQTEPAAETKAPTDTVAPPHHHQVIANMTELTQQLST